jgi:hypothetical protein
MSLRTASCAASNICLIMAHNSSVGDLDSEATKVGIGCDGDIRIPFDEPGRINSPRDDTGMTVGDNKRAEDGPSPEPLLLLIGVVALFMEEAFVGVEVSILKLGILIRTDIGDETVGNGLLLLLPIAKGWLAGLSCAPPIRMDITRLIAAGGGDGLLLLLVLARMARL